MSLDIFASCYTRLNDDISHLWCLTHYNLQNQCRGICGVTLNLKNRLKLLKVSKFSLTEPDIEIVSFETTTSKGTCFIAFIYRPPNGNIKSFISKLEEIFVLLV